MENILFYILSTLSSFKLTYNAFEKSLVLKLNESFPRFFVFYSYVHSFIYALASIFSAEATITKQNKEIVIGNSSWFPYDAFYYKLKKLLMLAYLNNNKIVEHSIMSSAKLLCNALQENKNTSGNQVILMPLHVFCDEFAIVVSGSMGEKKVVTIAAFGNDMWLDKWNNLGEKGKIKKTNESIDLFNPFVVNEKESATKMKNIIRSVRNNQIEFAIFADAIPEYTHRMNKEQNYKLVNFFGRQAHMHYGPFNLPKLMRADILPYYVYIEYGKIKIKIMDRISMNDIDNDLPTMLEEVIRYENKQWFLWHFTSFYYFNR